MVRLRWFDTVEVTPAGSLSMTCDDLSLPTDESNLCLKAASALARAHGVSKGANIRLTKRIPSGAGLGGGSSDAATTLRLLSKLWELDTTDADLARLGATIGADVPFFMGPSPALAEGIGERLTPLAIRLPFTFVVVKPPRSVSTAEAYQNVTPSDQGRADLVEMVGSLDLASWRTGLVNDFELSVAERLPEIGALKRSLYELGAGYAAMSGSGSAVFGVFDDEATARSAREMLAASVTHCWVGSCVIPT